LDANLSSSLENDNREAKDTAVEKRVDNNQSAQKRRPPGTGKPPFPPKRGGFLPHKRPSALSGNAGRLAPKGVAPLAGFQKLRIINFFFKTSRMWGDAQQQPGGRPDPHIPHDSELPEVGKPEGLSGSQTELAGRRKIAFLPVGARPSTAVDTLAISNLAFCYF